MFFLILSFEEILSFIKDFIQLTFSSLTFFLTWNRCIVILTFLKNVNLYFHIAISLGIVHKLNVHKTYVCSTYVLFPGLRDGTSKLY